MSIAMLTYCYHHVYENGPVLTSWAKTVNEKPKHEENWAFPPQMCGGFFPFILKIQMSFLHYLSIFYSF